MTEYNDKYDQDLISILAHDLRTPINSTRHFVDLAYHAGQQGNEELHEKYTERAQQGLDRMARLINDVLEMSRLEQDDGLQVEPCDLTMQVHECVGLLEGAALERDVTLTVDLPDVICRW